MKKLTILAVAFTAIIFAACGGKKSANNAAEADSLKSFEQQQIEASIKMHIDSIASEIGKLKQPAFVREDANGTISLTKEEKKKLWEDALKVIPLGRAQKPRDISWATAFIASDYAREITGQCLCIDGGQASGR